MGSFGRRRVGRVHGPSAVPRHLTATRTDTSSCREYDSRCAPRNVWLVVRIARRRERRQAGGGGGGGSQEADGRWQVAATPGGMGGLRQRREECEARATLERHRGAFGAPGRPLGRVRRRSAAKKLLPKIQASQMPSWSTGPTPALLLTGPGSKCDLPERRPLPTPHQPCMTIIRHDSISQSGRAFDLRVCCFCRNAASPHRAGNGRGLIFSSCRMAGSGRPHIFLEDVWELEL